MNDELGAVNTEIVETTDPQEPSEGATEVETVEVTEPQELPQDKKSADSAFAEMRRQNEEMQKRIAEYEYAEKIAKIEELAELEGVSPIDLLNALAEEEELENRNSEFERLREENVNLLVEKAMQNDLAEIQKIDPEIKSLNDLPESFLRYKALGATGVEAYVASKSLNELTSTNPAVPPGAVGTGNIERDYYTSNELDNLSFEEFKANKDKVERSLARL